MSTEAMIFDDEFQIPEDSLLLFDSNRGQYIPQNFAEEIDQACVYNVSDEDWGTLAAGPDLENEWYWEAWKYVLNTAVLVDGPAVYRLEQDGDVWLVKVGETFIAPAHWASALINGDYSGIDDDKECETITRCEAQLNGHISDALGEPDFMSPHRTDTPDHLAGDYLIYVLLPN